MHFVVFIYDDEIASSIGKKSSENGIIFYNRLINDDVVVGLGVIDLEKKFYDVAQAMLISNQIVISTKNIDAIFGELVIAAELCNKRIIFSDDNNIDKIISGLNLNYIICNQQEILNNIISYKNNANNEDTRIDIDAAFNVKGIGCVILGVITKGNVNIHDSLYHSSGRQVIVKSIQSQDRDLKTADTNTRVGLALKGIDVEDIEKGDLLTVHKTNKVSSIKATIKINKLASEEIAKGNRYTFISNFSYRVCIIEEINNNEITLNFEKAIVLQKNDYFFLLRNKSPRVFGIGITC